MDEATKRRRGELLTEQEEVQASIARVERTLKNSATPFKQLGEALTSRPDRVVFSNAPDDLGSYNPNALSGPAEFFNWQEVSNIREIARNVTELRKLKSQLETIQRQLSLQ